MCGIAGIIASSGWTQKALLVAAEAMAKTMYHRGPDAQGVWVDPQQSLMLAHRRLSIQDLSTAGNQPMVSFSGRFRIVFNGEIYNFKILTEELIQRGHSFRGHSDTEVLLTAIEDWGIETTIARCRGMFAMAIWDKQNREMILCRDRMGEKPLFFGWLNNCFVFASELKPLHRVFYKELSVNYDSLAAFLRFGYVPTPHSIYQNIFKLLPGSFLRIPVNPLPSVSEFDPFPCMSHLSPTPYWQIETIARRGVSQPIMDEKEAIEELDLLLRNAISQQNIADVPLGAFLSGGVDSSLVVAVMQAVSKEPISTFTIGFKEKEFDEAPYARAIAKHLGCNHYETYISAYDGLAMIEDIPWYWDEPFADSSQIPSLLIAKVARQKVTVCLTGDGGDELFCGYNRYFVSSTYWSKHMLFPQWLRKISSKTLLSIPPPTFQYCYNLLKGITGDNRTQANVGLKFHKFAGLMQHESMHEAYRYLMSYWQKPADVINHTKESSSILDRHPYPELGHFIQNAMFWDQLGYLTDDNLVKGDRASMSVGLETRLPLLDHRIVELSWRIPLGMKYRRGESKWLLRQLLYRYVPKELIERPKMGFSVPIGDWLRGPLKNWAEDLLHSSDNNVCDILNKQTIQKYWNQHLVGSHDHSHKIWAICMWKIWFEKYKTNISTIH